MGADALENQTDDLLSRFFGGDLQTATLRMVLYLAVISAVIATIAVLV